MNIHDIEGIKTESEARAMFAPGFEMVPVKGHTVMLVDLGGAFGYSALVFADGVHLTHANDYELHHRHMGRDELKSWYIDKMNRILFTEDELSTLCKDYNEECMRKRYLANIYSRKRPYISMFHIGERDQETEKAIKAMHPSCVGLAYYWDEAFVSRMDDLHEQIAKAAEASRNPEYMEQAFVSEMSNYEYGYSMDKDFEVISVFDKVPYIPGGTTEEYLEETSWSNEWKDAYRRAKSEYLERFDAC